MKKLNTLYVTLFSEKDKLGRQEFLLEWVDNNIGKTCNEIGIRGQNFFDVLSKQIKHFERKGFDIVYEPSTHYH